MTAALIAKLESASEGSRELSSEICILLQYGGLNSEGATNIRTDDDWDGDLLYEIGDDECCTPIPPVTTSIDAALALAERKGFDALLVLESAIYRARRHGQVPTTPDKIARFVCAALLRASAAEGAGE